MELTHRVSKLCKLHLIMTARIACQNCVNGAKCIRQCHNETTVKHKRRNISERHLVIRDCDSLHLNSEETSNNVLMKWHVHQLLILHPLLSVKYHHCLPN